MGYILFIVSIILVFILTVFSVILNPIYYLITFKWKTGGQKLNLWFLNLAISLDQFGNTSSANILNNTMIKSNGYKFGDMDQTVSFALGVNKNRGTLTKLGIFITYILHLIDENHVEKAVSAQKKSDVLARYRVENNNYK